LYSDDGCGQVGRSHLHSEHIHADGQQEWHWQWDGNQQPGRDQLWYDLFCLVQLQYQDYPDCRGLDRLDLHGLEWRRLLRHRHLYRHHDRSNFRYSQLHNDELLHPDDQCQSGREWDDRSNPGTELYWREVHFRHCSKVDGDKEYWLHLLEMERECLEYE